MGWIHTDSVEAVNPSMRTPAAALSDLTNRYNTDDTDIGERFFGT